jgi:hypothetical protein
VKHAGRAAGVGVGLERFAAFALLIVANGQIAGKQENLFPILVNERLGRIDARLEAKQTGAAPAFVRFVEGARENLLLDAGRIARGRLPSGGHVEGEIRRGVC